VTSVSELIVSSYHLAVMQHKAIFESWISGSTRLGSALPRSLLLLSIQRAGRLDVVLRCMEDDFASGTLQEQTSLFGTDHLALFSELWIGQVYEIVRLTRERKLIADSNFLKALAHDFRLLRIPMEKYQIAQDKSLTSPLSMSSFPAKNGDLEYSYDNEDPLRSHIMPTDISDRGSMQWLAIDIPDSLNQRWIERRDLSDRLLQLLMGTTSP
jgi:hypothetical protein